MKKQPIKKQKILVELLVYREPWSEEDFINIIDVFNSVNRSSMEIKIVSQQVLLDSN